MDSPMPSNSIEVYDNERLSEVIAVIKTDRGEYFRLRMNWDGTKGDDAHAIKEKLTKTFLRRWRRRYWDSLYPDHRRRILQMLSNIYK